MAISQRTVQYIAWLGNLGNVEQDIWLQLCRWLTSISALALAYELGPFQGQGFHWLDEHSNVSVFWGCSGRLL